MRYPEFFDNAPSITMFDPLAKFLGAAEGGILEYRYLDAVKAAGIWNAAVITLTESPRCSL